MKNGRQKLDLCLFYTFHGMKKLNGLKYDALTYERSFKLALRSILYNLCVSLYDHLLKFTTTKFNFGFRKPEITYSKTDIEINMRQPN